MYVLSKILALFVLVYYVLYLILVGALLQVCIIDHDAQVHDGVTLHIG